MSQLAADKETIRELVDRWSIFSDAGEWERFAECWHEDGFMCATWFQAPAHEFVAARRKGWENGVNIVHFHGGFTCDVVCTGRFYDFFEKRDGRWGMVRRQPIYEKDRMDPIEPGAVLALDKALLESFPEGYRHLAYLQSQIGYRVAKGGLPGLKGPEVRKLYAEGEAWLKGADTPGRPEIIL